MNEERRKRLIEISDKLSNVMLDLIMEELVLEEIIRFMSKTSDALKDTIVSVEDTRDSLQGDIEQ